MSSTSPRSSTPTRRRDAPSAPVEADLLTARGERGADARVHQERRHQQAHRREREEIQPERRKEFGALGAQRSTLLDPHSRYTCGEGVLQRVELDSIRNRHLDPVKARGSPQRLGIRKVQEGRRPSVLAGIRSRHRRRAPARGVRATRSDPHRIERADPEPIRNPLRKDDAAGEESLGSKGRGFPGTREIEGSGHDVDAPPGDRCLPVDGSHLEFGQTEHRRAAPDARGPENGRPRLVRNASGLLHEAGDDEVGASGYDVETGVESFERRPVQELYRQHRAGAQCDRQDGECPQRWRRPQAGRRRP